MPNERNRIWIDPFQTRLAGRMIFYCLSYQAALWIIFWFFQAWWQALGSITDGFAAGSVGLVALIAIIAFLAVIAYDAIRYAHRVVGPIYRFRKTIQALAAGEPVDMVRLRKDDFLKDLMDDFNQMLVVMEQKGAVALKERQPIHEELGRVAPHAALTPATK